MRPNQAPLLANAAKTGTGPQDIKKLAQGSDGLDGPDYISVSRKEKECVPQEPPCFRPFICTTNVFDGIALQCRPGEGAYDLDLSKSDNDKVIGQFRCTQAIMQSYCGVCTFGGTCCTHRSEHTHTLKITTKRIQISKDDAEGCWPTMDEDNHSIGNPMCGCCCLAPSGCIQTKVMGLLDVAGYAREVTVPRVQILGSMRFALSCWSLLVVIVYAIGVSQTEEGQEAAHAGAFALRQAAAAAAASAGHNVTTSFAEPPDTSTVPTILMGFAVISFLATFFYWVFDQVLKYGWKFVALCMLLVAPVGVFTLLNLDIVFQHLLDPELAQRLAPFACLEQVFAKAGIAAASLPIWLLIAWLYIAAFGVRQYKIVINFANQVSYTLTMRHEDVDEISEILARNISGEPEIIAPVDVAGRGLLDGAVDMPVNVPGKLLHEIRYKHGGGLKLTNVALATHSESYSFFCCGPEIYQLTEVFVHSPIIMTSLLTKMEWTTNLMPRMMRRLFYAVGALLLAAGVTCAIRDYTAASPGAPWHYQDGTPRWGVPLTAFGLFIALFPKLTGCCVSKLGLEFTWGTIYLYLTLSSKDADTIMKWILQATCRPGEYLQLGQDYGETELFIQKEAQAQSWMSPLRTLQITDLRIKITDDKTSVSYMRSGLTECDMGPQEWHERCFGVCKCQGWHRPNRHNNASLSLNFGWLKGLPHHSFPGTNLAMTERMTFSYQQCMKICQILDQPFGEFVHHVWSPTMYPADYGVEEAP